MKKAIKLLHFERKLHIKSLFYSFFMVTMQFEMNNYIKYSSFLLLNPLFLLSLHRQIEESERGK